MADTGCNAKLIKKSGVTLLHWTVLTKQKVHIQPLLDLNWDTSSRPHKTLPYKDAAPHSNASAFKALFQPSD